MSKLNLFEGLLEELSKEIESYNPDKKGFPILLSDGTKKSTAKFYNELKEGLITLDMGVYAPIMSVFKNLGSFNKFLREYVQEKEIIVLPQSDTYEEAFPDLDLYVDQESKEGDLFTAYKDTKELSPVSGKVYANTNGLSLKAIYAMAKPVARRYEPGKPLGEYEEIIKGKVTKAFNTYIPPEWIEEKNNVTVDKDPPLLFRKLVEHLFPIKEEQEFFYSWLHYSMHKRAYTFLVLCGDPGAGKNVLKKVIRALHGFENVVDGKKSTFSDRFNKQLQNCTLLWFDELRYTEENENSMKEVQNDTMSIEGKGVDATRSTRIHASMVIVNNKPRDNYIDFQARKFVPLQIRKARLETSLKRSEISQIVNSVEDPKSETFDKKFLAEIAEWVRKYGKSPKWPTLEYQGPMFYKLAHTSMTRWQKRTVQLIIEFMEKCPGKVEQDPEKGLRWSTMLKVEDSRKAGKGIIFPSHSSVEAFLESFRDGYGRECFTTTPYEGKMNIDEDFWVKCIVDEIKIFNTQDLKTREEDNSHAKKESKDVGRSQTDRREVPVNQKERANRPLEEKTPRGQALLERGPSRRDGRANLKGKETFQDLL